MTRDQACAVEISLIVVTDDRRHAHALLTSLNWGLYRYQAIEIANRETLFREFDEAVEASRGKRPVIVFLDCAFLRHRAEKLATRVRELQSSMAIECVATRPPAEPHRRKQLSELGASIFDGSEPAPAVRLPH